MKLFIYFSILLFSATSYGQSDEDFALAKLEFSLTNVFHQPASKIYNTFLSSDGHTAMTGNKTASIKAEIGSKFSFYDGYIWGNIIELRSNEFIKLSWRTKDFSEDQEDSILEIKLVSLEDGCTKLVLSHSNLTELDYRYVQGWVKQYFEPMESYFTKL